MNNVDLGGTSNDSDMSSFTVFHLDADGNGSGADVEVRLVGTTVDNVSGVASTTRRCSFRSSVQGPGKVGWAVGNVPCAVDLAATAFYYFEVILTSNGQVPAQPENFVAAFMGVRFP